MEGSEVERVRESDDKVLVTVGGDEHSAHALIIAEGAKSPSARQVFGPLPPGHLAVGLTGMVPLESPPPESIDTPHRHPHPQADLREGVPPERLGIPPVRRGECRRGGGHQGIGAETIPGEDDQGGTGCPWGTGGDRATLPSSSIGPQEETGRRAMHGGGRCGRPGEPDHRGGDELRHREREARRPGHLEWDRERWGLLQLPEVVPG
ncbi:MAG: hypothetical protein ACLFPN_03315 [Methanomassiliicoccales archaeon]